jgi:hypothetical protein
MWQRVAEMGKDDSPYRTTFCNSSALPKPKPRRERRYGLRVSYLPTYSHCATLRLHPERTGEWRGGGPQ